MEYLLKFKNILAISGITVFFVVVNFNTYSKHTLRINKINSELEEIEEGEEAINEWNRIRKEYRKLEDAFLIQETMPFKQFVRIKARQFDIKILSLKASIVEKDDYLESPMVVTIRCSYENFISFIKALEEKTIEMQRARIERKKDEAEVEAELHLTGLVIKDL